MGKLECEFKSPSGHLFESLTCCYIVLEIDLPDSAVNPVRGWSSGNMCDFTADRR